jgi:hypothetical protein
MINKTKKDDEWWKIGIIIGLIAVVFFCLLILSFKNMKQKEITNQDNENGKRFVNTFGNVNNQEEANAFVFTNLYSNYSWSKQLQQELSKLK